MNQKEEYLLKNVMEKAGNLGSARVVAETIYSLELTHGANFSMDIVINTLDSLISTAKDIKFALLKEMQE